MGKALGISRKNDEIQISGTDNLKTMLLHLKSIVLSTLTYAKMYIQTTKYFPEKVMGHILQNNLWCSVMNEKILHQASMRHFYDIVAERWFSFTYCGFQMINILDKNETKRKTAVTWRSKLEKFKLEWNTAENEAVKQKTAGKD